MRKLKAVMIEGERYTVPLFEALQLASMKHPTKLWFEVRTVSGKTFIGNYKRID